LCGAAAEGRRFKSCPRYQFRLRVIARNARRSGSALDAAQPLKVEGSNPAPATNLSFKFKRFDNCKIALLQVLKGVEVKLSEWALGPFFVSRHLVWSAGSTTAVF
jgi:hypothetical protein